jgi:hypothetical protein
MLNKPGEFNPNTTPDPVGDGDDASKKDGKQLEEKSPLDKILGDKVISDKLRHQLTSSSFRMDSLVVENADVAVAQGSRSEYGSTGGVGYFDQVRVFYGDQSKMQEWQWRDRYNARNDRHDLCVHSIGAIKVSEDDNSVSIEVELVNRDRGSRYTTFKFDKSKTQSQHILSASEQAAFQAKTKNEEERVLGDLNAMWKNKGKMLDERSGSYVPYRRPSIKNSECHPEIGVSAFITEEQIDHRVMDPQIRYELHVLTAGKDKVVTLAEDHGYDKGDGGAFITIVELTQDHIIINTKGGKQTIALDVKADPNT